MPQLDPAFAPPDIRSPEKSFLASVILEAWRDLDRHGSVDRYESIQFFLNNAPARRAWRRELCALLDINETSLQRIVRAKIGEDLPERPREKRDVVTSADVREILPDGHFTRNDIKMLVHGRLSYAQVASRFQQLEIEGVIERTRRGTYARVDWLNAEREALFADLPDEEEAA